MENLSFKGGAAIGLMRAKSYATLTLSKYKLELDAGFVGRMAFQPIDVISIEADKGFGLSGSGIRINHHVAGYKQKVIFYPEGNYAATLAAMQQCDFFSNKPAVPYEERERILLLQANGSFPIKTFAGIILSVIWNVLCFNLARVLLTKGGNPRAIFPSNVLPTAFLALMSLLILMVPAFRNLIIKEGRYDGKMRNNFLFILAVASAMLIVSQAFIRVK